jgi:hypothetical protein
MTDDTADRRQAIDEVRADRVRTLASLDAIDVGALATPGLGGGDWSPKDLLGHLESWEQHALDAIDAWSRGERPPVDVVLEALGTDEVNRREVERKAAIPVEQARASAVATHRALVAALEAAIDEWWGTPVLDDDGERTHGQRIGGILGGARGLFRHDPDHWDDLEAFGAAHPTQE